MPTIRADETQALSVQDTSSEQVVELQPNEGPSAPSQSRLIIELPPDIATDLENQPDAPPRGINLLLNEVEWDPVREILLLPSGLELAGIQTANNTTQITLADGTLLIIQGHSENPPSIEIENQILTAQEIQTAFAAARNAEPSAGPEAHRALQVGQNPPVATTSHSLHYQQMRT